MKWKLLLASAAVALSVPTHATKLEHYGKDAVPVQAPLEKKVRNVEVKYNGYVFGFRVLVTYINADLYENGYAAEAEFKTAGLAAFVKDSQIKAGTQGLFTGDRSLDPASYFHQNYDGKKNRRIEINFTDPNVPVAVEPAFGTWGDPAATPAEKSEAMDALAAWLDISMAVNGTKPCDRTVPVFDGKQRYNLRMVYRETERVRTPAYRGDAIRCDVYYEAVSGFDAEDLPDADESQKPAELWLGKFDGDFYFPVQIKRGSAFIEARRLNITEG